MNRIFFYIAFCLFSGLCQALDFRNTNFWTTAVIDGHFKTNPSYFYQISTHLRYNENPFLLRQNVDRIFIGKHLSERWEAILGMDYVPTRLPESGRWLYFQSLWQQLAFKHHFNKNWEMALWTRIDERRQQGASGTGWLNRSGINLSACPAGVSACPVMFFENFYYINQPQWEALTRWGQQRIYFAVKGVISPKTSVNVGYLGQFLWTKNLNQRIDILSIIFFHRMD